MDYNSLMARAEQNTHHAKKILKTFEDEKNQKPKNIVNTSSIPKQCDKNILAIVEQKRAEAKRTAEENIRKSIELKRKKITASSMDTNKATEKKVPTSTIARSQSTSQILKQKSNEIKESEKIKEENRKQKELQQLIVKKVEPVKQLSYADILRLADKKSKEKEEELILGTKFLFTSNINKQSEHKKQITSKIEIKQSEQKNNSINSKLLHRNDKLNKNNIIPQIVTVQTNTNSQNKKSIPTNDSSSLKKIIPKTQNDKTKVNPDQSQLATRNYSNENKNAIPNNSIQATTSSNSTSSTTNDNNKSNEGQKPISKLTQEQIDKLKKKSGLMTTNNNNNNNNKVSKEKELSIKLFQEKRPKISTVPKVNNNSERDKCKKSDEIVRNKDTSNNKLSAWDKIVSDLKIQKNVEKRNSKEKRHEEYHDDEEEDDDDSEMDDFIDDDIEEEETNTISKHIREIFKYDPKNYEHIDSDDEDMETDYHTQLREEKKSEKIGILEDVEEYLKEKKRLKKMKKKK